MKVDIFNHLPEVAVFLIDKGIQFKFFTSPTKHIQVNYLRFVNEAMPDIFKQFPDLHKTVLEL